jgi:hypothetical protein
MFESSELGALGVYSRCSALWCGTEETTGPGRPKSLDSCVRPDALFTATAGRGSRRSMCSDSDIYLVDTRSR